MTRSAADTTTIASTDRMLWSILAPLWRGWRGALFFVQPRAVILWQRKRFRDYWGGLSRGDCRGRPRRSTCCAIVMLSMKANFENACAVWG